jgi:hypothetical protein
MFRDTARDSKILTYSLFRKAARSRIGQRTQFPPKYRFALSPKVHQSSLPNIFTVTDPTDIACDETAAVGDNYYCARSDAAVTATRTSRGVLHNSEHLYTV